MLAIRVRLASLTLFACVGLLTGCGDDVPRQPDGGGGTAGGGGSAGAGGDSGGTGGSIGGSGGGGTAGGGSGGGGTAGGGSGGGGTGGGAGRGGSGGGGTGGNGATAGGGSGGGGTAGGGSGGGGTGGATPCYTVAFAAPINGATLNVLDDKTSTCADGFQYDVRITTNAPAGTDVSLYNGNALLRTVQVMNGAATFDVQLASVGQSALSIQFPSTSTCTDPSTRSTVTISCPSTAPTCTISAPTITPTHPALNGVLAPAGDRASQIGSPYQVSFQVTTNAEDGQPVTLSFNAAGSTTPTTLNATATGGAATFGVPLSPDGTYEVRASCRNLAGITGMSMLSSYAVDTTAPNLSVSQPTDGQFFGPAALTNGTFRVCGQTTSTDAAGLPASLGAAVNNLCVALGGSASCVGTAAVTAINTDACVAVTCPGGAPFNINVTIRDAAGNPTTNTIQGVSCASTLPSVQIIAPVSDAPAFNNPALHILSANAPVGVRDQNAATPGAQADVVACSDRAGISSLFAGQAGGALTQLGASVTNAVAVVTDNCPAGLGFVARFAGVTIPDSVQNADGTLLTATRLQVRVTDAINPSSIGQSSNVDVWVDPVAPILSLMTPAGLCGSFQQSSTTVTQTLTFNAENGSVVLQVANGATTDTYSTPAFANGVATFTAVDFDPGQSAVTASGSDPAGNVTTLLPDPCTVIIGSAPVVTFTTPIAGQVLCPVGSPNAGTCIVDAAPGTPGWQGNLTVHVSGDGAPIMTGNVTFSVGTTTLGTAALDTNGNATLANASLPIGMITVVATTDNVPNRGVGSGTVAVNVIDDVVPTIPTNLKVTVVDRRGVTMHLAWDAPNDSGGPAAGYQIRYAKVPITAANFDDTAVTTVVNTVGFTPAAPTQRDSIDVAGLYVESSYYFAVAATDLGGNRSAIASTPTIAMCTCDDFCCATHLNVTTLSGVGGSSEQFGFQFDSGDVDKATGTPGPSYSDLVVGAFTAKHAYLYLGVNGNVPSAPSVTFTGDASTTASFGRGVAIIGDIDADGFSDVAISDRGTPARIYIYKGRSTWPLTMTNADANYVVSVDATYNGSIFGSAMARLGDFNGDNIDDFVVGASLFGGTGQTGRIVVVLGRANFASFALPNATQTIVIDGDPAVATPQFGYRVVGLGHFYSVTPGTTLVASAPGNVVGTSGFEGRLYAFHGQAGTAGAIPIASADHMIVGPAGNNRIGIALANLGPILGPLPSLGSGNPVERVTTSTGNTYVFNGSSATGPFASKIAVYQAGAALSGMAVVGGGISGVDQSFSLIGDATPDLVMISRDTQNFAIIDGRTLRGATSPLEANAAASVSIAVPAGWGTTGEAQGRLIPDFDGDGHPDFAVGNALGTVAGRVVVYW
jgi:hypothetical protein